jgi:asparagine synthase (glutamine-hydrolysing)
LIGDWSLVIWDATARSVLLASDYAGIRPLYYYRSADYLLWSSSLANLVRWTGIGELDGEYVAGFLTRGSVARRTPYRGIYPVPPGHAVCVSRERVSARAFWTLPVHQETRFEDGRCYEEQLRNLFREAVSVRLRTDSPVCAELSGGLDSSSVVAMASQLMAGNSAGRSKPVTFSYTHGGCTDERYFKAVERACNLSGIHLDLEEYPFVAANQAASAAPSLWEPRLAELARRIAAIGSSVFLTGQLGDFIMGNTFDDSEQVADYLQQGHLLEAAHEAFAWSQSLQAPIYSILWRALRTSCSSWTASTDPRISSGVCSCYAHVDSLARKFRKRFPPHELERLRAGCWRQASPGRRRRFRALSEMLEARMLQAPETLQHISYTHPFAHRPLVEFMLTIPAGEVCRPGEPRRLMRRAFAGFLPAAILKRKSKAVYTRVYRQALVPLAAELLMRPESIRLVELGYVDRQSITERLTRFVQGLDCNESQLRQLILFEFWFRNRENSGHRIMDTKVAAEPGVAKDARLSELAVSG